VRQFLLGLHDSSLLNIWLLVVAVRLVVAIRGTVAVVVLAVLAVLLVVL
jgi:hypothetical protein